MVKQLHYESWFEFKKEFYYDLTENTQSITNYIFRGQSNEDWKLVSSFDRYYKEFTFTQKKKIEKYLLECFIDECEKNLGLNLLKYNEEQKISLAQHYGVPTRLLDWSRSPYISAFFAYANAIIDSNCDNVAVWALNKNSEIWEPRLGCSIVETKTPENTHQKSQNGLFTMLKTTEISLEDYVNSCEQKGYDTFNSLIKIVLPINDKPNALEDLELMGINYTSLFSGMESCANSAILKTTIDIVNKF